MGLDLGPLIAISEEYMEAECLFASVQRSETTDDLGIPTTTVQLTVQASEVPVRYRPESRTADPIVQQGGQAPGDVTGPLYYRASIPLSARTPLDGEVLVVTGVHPDGDDRDIGLTLSVVKVVPSTYQVSQRVRCRVATERGLQDAVEALLV